jgi:WD repeat-containing protein 68
MAHDHQVCAISFCSSSPAFLTGGLEGSVRFFDLRDLVTSYVYFQTTLPVLRISVSKVDPTKFAAFAKDGKTIFVVDVRQPGIPCHTIRHPNGIVTSMGWSALLKGRMFSCDFKGNVIVSDLLDGIELAKSKVIHQTVAPIQNMALGSGVLGLVTNTGIDFVNGQG